MLALITRLGVRFSQSPMLIWLVAALLPLLLAWWFRRRLPPIAFGAIGILRKAVDRRQMPWRQTGRRLLLQVLFIVALVTAAARPLWHADSSVTEPTAVERVWVVKGWPEQPADSASVDAVTAVLRLQGWLSGDGSLVTALQAALPGEVMVLSDGAVPTPEETEQLWRWVKKGGGLILLMGPRTLAADNWPDWQKSLFIRTGVAAENPINCAASQLYAVPALHADETTDLAELGDGRGLLPGPTIDRLIHLELPADHREWAILASEQAAGLPVAISAPCGRGGITISALPLSLAESQPPAAGQEPTRWSDLTAWPVFLPYIHGLFRITRQQSQAVAMARPAWLSVPGLFLLAIAALALASDGFLASGYRRAKLARGMVALMLIALAWRMTWSADLEAGSQSELRTGMGMHAASKLMAAVPPLCWPGEMVEIPVTIRAKAGEKGQVVLVGQEGQLTAASWSLPATDATGPSSSPARETRVSVIWPVSQTQRPGPCQLTLKSQTEPASEEIACSFEITTVMAPRPARLLVLEAEPRFEYRFLLQAIAGDPRLQTESRLLAGPGDAEPAAIEWSKYDVVWLGDVVGPRLRSDGPVKDSLLSSKHLAELGEEVTAGRLGVAWVPGERFQQAGFVAGPAAEWLPVTVAGPLAAVQARGPAQEVRARPAGVEAGWLPSDQLALGEAFELLGPVGLKPTTVLLATTGRTPPAAAIVLGRLGAGQIVGHLTETWRWRASASSAGRDLHEAYWRQTLIRLATPAILSAGSTEVVAPIWPAVFSLTESDEEIGSIVSLPPGNTLSNLTLDHFLVAVAVLSVAVAWWLEDRRLFSERSA